MNSIRDAMWGPVGYCSNSTCKDSKKEAMLTVLLGFMACWGGDLTNHATKKQELQFYMLFVNIQ
jgi:hypothetical protein